jgi:hypothetical protein
MTLRLSQLSPDLVEKGRLLLTRVLAGAVGARRGHAAASAGTATAA